MRCQVKSANTLLIHRSDKQLILPMNKVISTSNKETDHSIKAMEKEINGNFAKEAT